MDSGPLVCNAKGNILEYSIDLLNEKHLDEILLEYDALHIEACNEIINLTVKDQIRFKPQTHAKATYSCHRGPEDGEINWTLSTQKTFNFIRALSKPCSGSFTYYKGKKVYLRKVRPRFDYANYLGRIEGKVVHRNLNSGSAMVLTSDGAIEILSAEVSKSNKHERPSEIFYSIRDRCKSKVESFVESNGW